MLRALFTTVLAIGVLGGCATSHSTAGAPAPAPPATRTASRQVDPSQVERLRRAMLPLVQAMDHPIPRGQVKLGIIDDSHINAANAGNGQFYVTTGLLERADDDHLLGVLAHEVAHQDLGHVAKAKTLGTGLSIGMILLDQIVPGSGALTPIAGELIQRGYGRREEYQADAHGAELLQRVGRNRQLMIDTLTWLMQTEGTGSGGFFSTHPATGDRIDALRNARS